MFARIARLNAPGSGDTLKTMNRGTGTGLIAFGIVLGVIGAILSFAVTVEASAIEAIGHAPRLVPGSLENFKITWPGDFDLAERLLRTRS